ncbi:BTB/POZ domain-containing protein [Phthorimaea operculella]|nr:BTB/POZ domain-containing protein [Phthorimaea operculella]
MEDQGQKDGVVFGHKVCQTKEAKWLCIEDAYEKFYRNNMYDIGGTYIEDIADFWFLYKVENVGNIFLMHIFVNNRQEGDFTVSLSYNNDFKLDKKKCIAYLPTHLKDILVKTCGEMTQNYLTTYSFTEVDLECLKDMKLYIAVSFAAMQEKGVKKEIIEKVKLEHDFSALMEEPICSDFVIESADGEKFNVHKVLLSAHSEVFKAMLKEDTAESLNNYVKLPDVATEDLKGLLEFIYTGTIKDLENANFFNLLMLADQYNLDGLRELSQYAIIQQMTVSNALEILVLGDMYNSDRLKQASLNFIKKNVAALKSSTFKEIKNVDLVRELCEYMVQ